MSKTFIQGKDAALEDSISHFQTTLQALGFDIEEASWLNPVPNVWSVHIRDKVCSLCFTNGKGATQKAALASALGEYFERLSTNYFFADFYLGEQIANSEFVHYPNEKWFLFTDDDSLPAGILDDYLLAHYDPSSELFASGLVDLQSSNPERGICALPYVRQQDQQTVYIPMNIIANLYVSNGMSAGNTVAEARVQGLSEVFERFVKNKVIAERISLPEIPSDVISRYPTIQAAISKLEEEGFPIYCFDASLDGKYPVIAVVLLNPNNGSCFASFGAHPNFEVALERSVTELLQGRSLKELDVFSPPTFDDEEVADNANLETHFIDSSGVISWDLFKDESDYEFVDWSFTGTTEEELSTLLAIIHDAGYQVYIMDYQHLGVYACRILVPGMSEIYPSEDLLYANNAMGIHLREMLLALPDQQATPEYYLELLAQLDDEGLDEATRVRELLGIATGSNNGWFTLRVGELKAMLALAGGDLEQALIWVEWTRDFNQSTFSDERNLYYRCLHTLLLLNEEPARELEEYESVFKRMYGEQAYDAAIAAIEGRAPFYGLFSISSDFTELPAHQSLLAAYEKLQAAKRKYQW